MTHADQGQCDPRCWDGWSTHKQLARLTAQRARFRIARTLQRIRSPRRIVATSLAILFFALYLLNGIFILSARDAADPQQLRLWLSGGMAIYAIYHVVRCAWSEVIADLELTAAEKLWLSGAPLQRSTLAVYHLGNVIISSALKTLLLVVVLVRDVAHPELLIVGVFTSLLLLESSRAIIQRFSAGLSDSQRRVLRVVATIVACLLVLQVLARVIAATPMGSPTLMYFLNVFQGLGQTAACDAVQWLSLPWIAGSQIAVTEHYQWITPVQILVALALVPLSIILLVRVDAWTSAQRLSHEQQRLAANQIRRPSSVQTDLRSRTAENPLRTWLEWYLPESAGAAIAVISRQAVSVCRYKGTITVSFIIPMVLCLSPLVTGQLTEQWLFIVGGIAMCTMLLAPPALKLDFRRDLKRMLLLRSMPVGSLSMVLGQLTLPILITWTFQWITILVAALIIQPGWMQVVLWTGMLNALAVFTFAGENALFLAFPHHQHSEGVAMMVRAKLTFLGKGAVIAAAVGLLGLWAMMCQRLPDVIAAPALLAGALIGTWSIAAIAVVVCTNCWRRFDLALDVPPE